jgi:phosphatidylglycerophosphate synthase
MGPPRSWIPNLLTGLRLILVPTFVMVARAEAGTGGEAGWTSPTLWIVAAAGLSDVADGFLARRWDLTSRFGALMDAVADKSFQFASLVTITLLGRPLFSQLPIWLLGSVFLRDLVLLIGWIVLRGRRHPVNMEHEVHGKVATVMVFALVVSACMGWPEGMLLPAAVIASGAAILSALAYMRRGLRLASEPPGASG